jgi:hypothetical protein
MSQQTYFRCMLSFFFLLVLNLSIIDQAVAEKKIKPLMVYDDALKNNFVDKSWADHELNQQVIVKDGNSAIMFKPESLNAIYFYNIKGFDLKKYKGLKFWVYGSGDGQQLLRVGVTRNNKIIKKWPVDYFLPNTRISSGRWDIVKIPFDDFDTEEGMFDGVMIQDMSGKADQDTVYIDNLKFVVNFETTREPDISISPGLECYLGEEKIGQSRDVLTLKIRNQGKKHLQIESISLSERANFKVDLSGGLRPCRGAASIILPNDFCSLSIIFKPVETGLLRTVLNVRSNDHDSPWLKVKLSGSGVKRK